MSPRAGSANDDLVRSWLQIRDGYLAASGRIAAAVEEATGLPRAWTEVLAFIMRAPDGSVTMNALAAELGMSSGGLTRLVDRLIDEGLLSRSTTEQDRRIVLAELTDLGAEQAAKSVTAEIGALRGEVFAALSVKQLGELTGLMAAIRDGSPTG